MTSPPDRPLPPLPVPDEVSARFWDAAREGRLVIQRCGRSGRSFHPPVHVCTCCGQSDLQFERVRGRGVIYSFVVMRDQRVQGFEDRVPYVNVWVELEEQPHLVLVTNLVDAELSDVAIGAPVEVSFEKLSDEITLPQFRLVRETGESEGARAQVA